MERGLSGPTPGADSPPYLAICCFLFDSLDDFLAAHSPDTGR